MFRFGKAYWALIALTIAATSAATVHDLRYGYTDGQVAEIRVDDSFFWDSPVYGDCDGYFTYDRENQKYYLNFSPYNPKDYGWLSMSIVYYSQPYNPSYIIKAPFTAQND